MKLLYLTDPMVCASSAWQGHPTLASATRHRGRATPRHDGATTDTLVEANPYLEGPYAPIHTEIDATDLEVIGEIPRDLDGVYLRNGPNPSSRPPAATTGSTATHGARGALP